MSASPSPGQSPRVAVLGAGAIGSLAGGLIARDAPVTLVGRGAHIDAVAARGLRLEGAAGEHHVSAISAAVITSTLQSLKRGQKTEIEHLNGQIVRLARSIGDDAPVNARVVEIVHAIEAGAPFLSPSEVRKRFAGLVETW